MAVVKVMDLLHYYSVDLSLQERSKRETKWNSMKWKDYTVIHFVSSKIELSLWISLILQAFLEVWRDVPYFIYTLPLGRKSLSY